MSKNQTSPDLKLITSDSHIGAVEQLAALQQACENRDTRDALIYQTLQASIELLEGGASGGMVADVLRLARNSMTEAWELLSANRSGNAGVSHG
jgi:hypothetical protein